MAEECSTTSCRMESRGRKGAKKVAHATGKAIEEGVIASEKMAKRAAPAAKTLYEEGKKGVKKVKEKTLKAAKKMENW